MTLAAKSLLRVGSPVVLAVSTNDGLGASGENMARLCQRKHYYFVPYGQDDPFAKPQSLKADLALLPAAVAGGVVSAQANPLAFYALCAADPMAWIAADIVLAIPFFRNILRRDYRYMNI